MYTTINNTYLNNNNMFKSMINLMIYEEGFMFE